MLLNKEKKPEFVSLNMPPSEGEPDFEEGNMAVFLDDVYSDNGVDPDYVNDAYPEEDEE